MTFSFVLQYVNFSKIINSKFQKDAASITFRILKDRHFIKILLFKCTDQESEHILGNTGCRRATSHKNFLRMIWEASNVVNNRHLIYPEILKTELPSFLYKYFLTLT